MVLLSFSQYFQGGMILGMDADIFIGMLLGIALATYIVVWRGYKQYKLKVNNLELRFDNRYITSVVSSAILGLMTLYYMAQPDGALANMGESTGIVGSFVLAFMQTFVVSKVLNKEIHYSARKDGIDVNIAVGGDDTDAEGPAEAQVPSGNNVPITFDSLNR